MGADCQAVLRATAGALRASGRRRPTIPTMTKNDDADETDGIASKLTRLLAQVRGLGFAPFGDLP